MSDKRKTGYYWVRHKDTGAWFIAYYQAEGTCGCQHSTWFCGNQKVDDAIMDKVHEYTLNSPECLYKEKITFKEAYEEWKKATFDDKFMSILCLFLFIGIPIGFIIFVISGLVFHY